MNEKQIYEDMIKVLEAHRQVLLSEIDNYKHRIEKIDEQNIMPHNKCTVCGKPNHKDNKLCRVCGARLKVVA